MEKFRIHNELRKLCINSYGEELIEMLVSLPETCTLEEVRTQLQIWLDTYIFPKIKDKSDYISIFATEYLGSSFSRRLASALPNLSEKWRWKETKIKEQAIAILTQCFNQFIYDVRTEGKEKNIRYEDIEKIKRQLEIQAENIQNDKQRYYRLRQLQDPVQLAAELYHHFNEKYSENSLLETIFEMSEHIPIDYMNIDKEISLLEKYAPDIFDNWIEWRSFEKCLTCKQCTYPLTKEEQIAIEISIKSVNENLKILCQEYGINRETHRLRFKNACQKILNCLNDI